MTRKQKIATLTASLKEALNRSKHITTFRELVSLADFIDDIQADACAISEEWDSCDH